MMNTCIFLSPEPANFDNATKKCEEMDGQLYEPKTLFHNQLVYAIIEEKERTRQAFYIGIHDRYEEGSFVYLSNNQSILFESWGSYTADTFGVQPDNFGGNEHCVLFNGAKADNWNWISHLGTWSDFQCDQS